MNTGEDGVQREHSKSLSLSGKTTSLISCLLFIKPNQRREPTSINDAYEIILKCTSSNAEIPDLIWIILRNLSRDIMSMPISIPCTDSQIIPFWTGYKKITTHFML